MEPTVFIDVANNPDAPIVVLHAHDYDERFDVRVGLCKYKVPEYTMITIADIDWNNDLTPWKADAIMKDIARSAQELKDIANVLDSSMKKFKI